MVQLAVGDTHAPNKFINIGDLFLMGFGSEDDGGTPGFITWSNPATVVGEKDLNLCHDDLALVRPIARLPAAHWRQTASINTSEFEMKDGFHDTGRVKIIQMRLND